jgi:hypothetical protein
MQFSDFTKKILHNYTKINDGIVMKSGESRLRIKNQSNTIYSECDIDETFPKDVCIYNLHTFLTLLKTLDNPDIEFEQNKMSIKKGNSRTNLTYGNPLTILQPTNEPSYDGYDVSFVVSQKNLEEVIRVSNLLNLPDLKIITKNNSITLVVFDRNNPSSNTFEIDTEQEGNGKEYIITIDMLIMIPTSYNVKLWDSKISFESFEIPTLKYIMGLHTKKR